MEEPSKKSKKATGNGVNSQEKSAPNGAVDPESLREEALVPLPDAGEGKVDEAKKKRRKKNKSAVADAVVDATVEETEVVAPRSSPMVVSKPMGGRMATIDPIITPDEK
jgi:hypothetical protein